MNLCAERETERERSPPQNTLHLYKLTLSYTRNNYFFLSRLVFSRLQCNFTREKKARNFYRADFRAMRQEVGSFSRKTQKIRLTIVADMLTVTSFWICLFFLPRQEKKNSIAS